MSDEKPKSLSEAPPTDEIDAEWNENQAESKAEPAGDRPKKAAPSAKDEDDDDDQDDDEDDDDDQDDDEDDDDDDQDDDEDDDDDDDDDDDQDAHSKSARPATPESTDLIPDWGPWAVLGTLVVLGLVGGLGGLNGVVSLEKARPEEPVAAAPSAVAAASAPRPARPMPSAVREIDPKDKETIEASHLLVSYQGARRAQPTVTRTKEEAKKRAEEALAKAKKKGATFEKVVADYSDEPKAAERGGSLGAFTRRRMAKEFSDAAFALQPGEMSGVVESPFGFHVIVRTK